MKKKNSSKFRKFIKVLCLLAIIYLMIPASNDRDWVDDQVVLAYAEIEGDLLHFHNVRNITYRTAEDYDLAYYDKTYDLNQLETIDFLLSNFADWQGPAHAFLSFGFNTAEGMEYLSVSVEARKEVEEDYSPVLGLFKKFELIYIIADENDVVKLRTNYREDPVYLFPIKTTQERIQKIFLSIVTTVNELYETPRHYNTLTDACTTRLADHVNEVVPGRIPWSYKVIIPGYSYELAYDLGLIDTDVPADQLESTYLINDVAMEFPDPENFSEMIRQNLK